MERLHPGVYIQEVPGGARPIQGVSTSTTAFVGKAQKGRTDQAELVTNFTEFQSTYGDFLSDSFLAHAALQYFNNGGTRLYVVRVVASTGTLATTATTNILDRQGAPQLGLTVTALSPGSWANGYSVAITPATIDPANQYRLTVSRGTDVLETFDNLSPNVDAASFADRAIKGRSRFITVTTNPASTSAAAGTSVSAAGAATALTDPAKKSLVIEVNSDGPRTITLAGPTTTGVEIAAAIQTAVRALPPLKLPGGSTAYSLFAAGFAGGVYTLTSGATGRTSAVRVTNVPAASNAAGLLKLGLANGGAEVTGAVNLRPQLGSFPLGATTIGLDGSTPTDSDHINGLAKLDALSDVNIVAIPGRGTAAIVDAGTGYCTGRQDCIFIGEASQDDDTTSEVTTFVNALTVKSSYGAVYFPWVRATDPTGQAAAPILLPPSGYIAGIYARTDARRGVWKAPAGTEANLSGTVGLAAQLNDAQQDVLNPIGANLIRFFPSSGVVVWGARTLATLSDPEYRYVPVRRLAMFLERSIYNGIQWAVFEPNDEGLWASLRLNIGAFMMNMFRAGAFQGSTPSQAFFVKCDAETNPQSEIDAGVVTVLVAFAPVKPAEFVVIKISQKTSDAAS
jgi:phage tail sheath protein FI